MISDYFQFKVAWSCGWLAWWLEQEKMREPERKTFTKMVFPPLEFQGQAIGASVQREQYNYLEKHEINFLPRL